MKSILALCLSLFVSHAVAAETFQSQLQKVSHSHAKDSTKLDQIFQIYWTHLMETYPEWATYIGYPGQNDRWTDNSQEAFEQRKKDTRAIVQALKGISTKRLKPEEALSYDLLLKEELRLIEGEKFHEEYLAINQMGGIQMDVAELMWTAPKNNLKDYEDMIARLKASPKAIANVKSLLEKGVQAGITPARITLVKIPEQMDQILKSDVKESSIYKPFSEIKDSFPEADRKKIQEEAATVIHDQVYPALKDFKNFVEKTYIPHCRENVSFSSVPLGKEWYAYKVRFHTTVDMSPDEIHELGLKEVARIQGEMEKVKNQVKFKGDLKAFNEFLKNDPQFYYTKAEDLMVGFRDIGKRIDPELPTLFGRLPRLPWGVREMPAYKAPTAPTAYYEGGSLEAGRAGYFETNTYNLKARPKWQMEALTLHEAVPGHHLQISLAQELEGLPTFRKNMGPTAFVEGWGLYAEGLGEDVGLYKDPYSKYGQLTFEIWRAIRLVVDTGLHSKGWSRDQVIQYFKDHSPISEQQIINETDRYIADPGQALAYKIGELKFKDLRKRAKDKLGAAFSIREFHDQLLGSGALPLDIVEKKMTEWMTRKVNGVKTSPKGEAATI